MSSISGPGQKLPRASMVVVGVVSRSRAVIAVLLVKARAVADGLARPVGD